jgi:hypothetical protein
VTMVTELLRVPGGDLAMAGVAAGIATVLLASAVVLWRVARELHGRGARSRSGTGPVEIPARPRTHPFVAAAAGTSMPDVELARFAGIPRDLLPMVRASAGSMSDPEPARVTAQAVAQAAARKAGTPATRQAAPGASAAATLRGAPLTYGPARRGPVRGEGRER